VRNIVATPYAQLPPDAGAASTGYKREHKASFQVAQHLARSGLQLRLLLSVESHPQTVGFVPFRAREVRRAVNAMPIRRVMALKFRHAPAHPQSGKHAEISLRVSVERIQQRSVPIKQDALDGALPARALCTS
jgi:hypothetical protein